MLQIFHVVKQFNFNYIKVFGLIKCIGKDAPNRDVWGKGRGVSTGHNGISDS